MRTTGQLEKTVITGRLHGFVALTRFGIDISADGSEAFFTLYWRGAEFFRCRAAYPLMARLYHAVGHTIRVMSVNQMSFLDAGRSATETVLADPLRPSYEHCKTILDRTTGEVKFLLQFPDEMAPLGMALSVPVARAWAQEVLALCDRSMN